MTNPIIWTRKATREVAAGVGIFGIGLRVHSGRLYELCCLDENGKVLERDFNNPNMPRVEARTVKGINAAKRNAKACCKNQEAMHGYMRTWELI